MLQVRTKRTLLNHTGPAKGLERVRSGLCQPTAAFSNSGRLSALFGEVETFRKRPKAENVYGVTGESNFAVGEAIVPE